MPFNCWFATLAAFYLAVIYSILHTGLRYVAVFGLPAWMERLI